MEARVFQDSSADMPVAAAAHMMKNVKGGRDMNQEVKRHLAIAVWSVS